MGLHGRRPVRFPGTRGPGHLAQAHHGLPPDAGQTGRALAALHPEAAVTAATRTGRLRIWIGVALVTLGTAVLVLGALTGTVAIALPGGILSFLGILLSGSVLIPPVAALLVGVTLIVMVLVGSGTASASLDAALDRNFTVDFSISAIDEPLPEQAATRLRGLPGIAEVATLTAATVHLGSLDTRVIAMPASAPSPSSSTTASARG